MSENPFSGYNPKCAGVKRLMREALELREPTEMFYAQPLEDNLFEWHFTVRGTIGSDFDGGIYHGRIIFPPDYPMKPPNMIILTPNGRFELNRKICLSISGYHPETWLPSWSIRTALLALIGFMPSKAGGALGSLDYPPKERQKLAKASVNWKCSHCNVVMKDVLLPVQEDGKASAESEEAKNLAAKLKFADETTVKKAAEAFTPDEATAKSEEENTAGNSEIKRNDSQEENSGSNGLLTSEATTTPTSSSSSEQSVSSSSQVEDSSLTENANLAPSIRTPSPPTTRRVQSSESCDYTLFIFIPLITIIAALFLLLLARRILIVNNQQEQ